MIAVSIVDELAAVLVATFNSVASDADSSVAEKVAVVVARNVSVDAVVVAN